MKDVIFQRFFGGDRKDGNPLLSEEDRPLFSFVYNAAHDEISRCEDDDDLDAISVLSFEEKVESVMIQFNTITEVFKMSFEAKDNFLKNYRRWSVISKESIKTFRLFAEEIQKDKFNSDIAKVVGSVVGTIGSILMGVSFFTPLAAVTVPLAIGGGIASGLGGGVLIGTAGTEIALVKSKLTKVQSLLKEVQERFEAMSQWFCKPEELENAINNLVDYDIFNEVAPKVQDFMEYSEQKKMTDQEFRHEFKKILRISAGKMNENNNLTDKYGKELACVVITFVFVVCLMKNHNGIVLKCAMVTQRMALGLLGVVDLGVLAGALLGKLAARGVARAIAKFVIAEIFTCLGALIDILNMVMSSIDIHKRAESKHAKKVEELAEKMEKINLFIEGVYNETKKYKSPTDENQWVTVIIVEAPDDAEYEELKIAVKRYLPEKSWRKMKIRRLDTRGNNWLVKIPEIYSERLLQETHLVINEKKCKITQ